jgi:hypothetical protein
LKVESEPKEAVGAGGRRRKEEEEDGQGGGVSKRREGERGSKGRKG